LVSYAATLPKIIHMPNVDAESEHCCNNVCIIFTPMAEILIAYQTSERAIWTFWSLAITLAARSIG